MFYRLPCSDQRWDLAVSVRRLTSTPYEPWTSSSYTMSLATAIAANFRYEGICRLLSCYTTTALTILFNRPSRMDHTPPSELRDSRLNDDTEDLSEELRDTDRHDTCCAEGDVLAADLLKWTTPSSSLQRETSS